MTSLKRSIGMFLVLAFLASGAVCRGAQAQPITLAEALELAFQHNINYSLFLWERELEAKEQQLEDHPRLSAEIKPGGLRNGQWQGPQGSIGLEMPLGSHFNLSGTVTVGLDKGQLQTTSLASLVWDYSPFADRQKREGGLTPEQILGNEENALVVEVVDLFLKLRRQIDSLRYEQAYRVYLDSSLEAAGQTLDYNELPLKREIREQVLKLGQIEEDLAQLQLEMAALLGAPAESVFRPVLAFAELHMELAEEDYLPEVQSCSAGLRRAQAELEHVRERLERERKTGGWNLNARGRISQDLSWEVGLTAQKELYPRHLILERLELDQARAKQAVAAEEEALGHQLQGALQSVKAAQNALQLQEELKAEAREDWERQQRRLEAGLATELQVRQGALLLERAELDFERSQMIRGQAVLTLWQLCGRDLRSMVHEVFR